MNRGYKSHVDYQGRESILPQNDSSEKDQTGASASSQDELEKKAQKEAEEKAENLMKGVLQLVPHAKYRAKQVWYLKGFSDIFDGNYYFKQVTHKINIDRGYTVTARVVKNELGGDDKETDDERREQSRLDGVTE